MGLLSRDLFPAWNIVIEVKTMLVVPWIRWMRGIVEFKIQGEHSERFLNLLRKNNIPVFHIKRVNESVFAETFFRKYQEIRPFVRKTHVKVQIKSRKGFPFWVQKYAKRLGVLFGVLLFLGTVSLSGQFIWDITLDGVETLNEEDVFETLSELGLQRGKWKHSLDAEQIAMQLRHNYKEIGWATVNIVGSIAQVEIDERLEGEEIVEDKTPCNIVASRGGQIVQMEVYDGQKVLDKGSAVKKGDLLVSGIVKGSKENLILRHAKAKVLAEYSESHQVCIPMNQMLKIACGPTKTYYYLNLGNFRLPLFAFQKKPEMFYQDQFIRPIKIWGVRLPFNVTVQRITPAQIRKVSISKEKALQLAEIELKKWEENFPNREIVSRKIKCHQKSEMLIADANYLFREDIAQQENIHFNEK